MLSLISPKENERNFPDIWFEHIRFSPRGMKASLRDICYQKGSEIGNERGREREREREREGEERGEAEKEQLRVSEFPKCAE